MSKDEEAQIVPLLKDILQKVNSLEEKVDKKFERTDTQFQSLNLSITLIGADVDQLKRRVGRIERHLDISGDMVGN